MKDTLKTKYDPKEVEIGKYDFWLNGGFFKAGDKTKEPFTIVIPPPNVTGRLHLGHAWDTTLQDIIIRRKRMQGYDALWLPGMDHAGIATQAKVDEKLRSQGISRYELGREEYLKVAWSWKEEYAKLIRSQWASLGLSLDYSKERFTLDEGLNQAVNHVFIALYNKGLIYQGERVINWDCQAKTALSNIEVEYKEIEGAFYHFKYMLTDNSGYVEVATTRPETMFGDQAIMVHPNDTRYTHLIGKSVYIPGTNVIIPIISDEYVDMEFGTGCVKVTPAHDPNDFEVGKRKGLSMPLCMNEDGTMNELAFQYVGQDRFTCRKNLTKDLEALDLVVKIEKHIHNVGHSERTNVIVEPRLSKQWFVKMDVLAKNAVQKNDVIFVPSRFKQTFHHWMENIQDWCVSRQLWWGHRIPAWYKDNEVLVCQDCPGDGWIQDEDVLDTWFSSALWPFSTLGWPNDTEDLKRYYPTNVLVTGYDIIFFWVSRMIFQGIEFTSVSPFKEVLIHGLIRDKDGLKMSKSLGNGVDPMDVKEKYGADTLRYFLTTNSAPGLDLRFDETKIESTWNYLNKIWNISRYILMNLEGFKKAPINYKELNESSKWILKKLNNLIKNTDVFYEKYEFGIVASEIYKFVWEDFASWYIELTKVDLADATNKNNVQNVLVYTLETVLKLLHPFVPFITEEIYQSLPNTTNSIMIATWPVVCDEYNDYDDKRFEIILSLIVANRNVRAKVNKPLSAKINIVLSCKDDDTVVYLKSNVSYLTKFMNPQTLEIKVNYIPLEEVITEVFDSVTMYIKSGDLIDKEKEIERLKNEINRLESEIKRGDSMLANPGFISKAPQERIDAENEKIKMNKEKLQAVTRQLNEIVK